jgi:hypothetical protein
MNGTKQQRRPSEIHHSSFSIHHFSPASVVKHYRSNFLPHKHLEPPKSGFRRLFLVVFGRRQPSCRKRWSATCNCSSSPPCSPSSLLFSWRLSWRLSSRLSSPSWQLSWLLSFWPQSILLKGFGMARVARCYNLHRLRRRPSVQHETFGHLHRAAVVLVSTR